jgi:hypothetical protein
MAQTVEGSKKIAAQKAGVTLDEYERLLSSGIKWCTGCRAWHATTEFGADVTRWDGLAAICGAARRAKAKAKYQPKPRPTPGRSFVPARDGDAAQARRRINYFVEAGLIPHPNELRCSDCSHQWTEGDRRHEYDHHLGYAAEHHEYVEPVCTSCHARREADRALEGLKPHKRTRPRKAPSLA